MSAESAECFTSHVARLILGSFACWPVAARWEAEEPTVRGVETRTGWRIMLALLSDLHKFEVISKAIWVNSLQIATLNKDDGGW